MASIALFSCQQIALTIIDYTLFVLYNISLKHNNLFIVWDSINTFPLSSETLHVLQVKYIIYARGNKEKQCWCI